MAQNPMMGAPIQPAAPSSPSALNFQSDPANRASFKGFMTSLSALPNISTPQPAPMASPMPAPMVPAADVDIFQPMMPVQGFADGGYAEAAYGGESNYGDVSYGDIGGGFGDDDPGDDVMDIGYGSGQVDPGLAMAAQSRTNFTAGPAPSAQDDIVGGVDLPFSSITTSPSDSGTTFVDTSSMPTISEQAVRDQYSLGRGGFEPTAPAFAESMVQASVASPKPRPDISALAAPSLFEYDVDLLGLPLDPAREMRGLQQEARAQDFTERLGSAVVNEGFGDTRVTAPSQPMDADETYTAQRSRQDALARELSDAGKTVTVDPVTGNVSEFDRREISPTEFNMFGDVVGVGGSADNTLANLAAIGNAPTSPSVPTPMPRPGTLVDYSDPTQVPMATVDVPMPAPRPGVIVGPQGPYQQADVALPRSRPQIPPQVGELGAMGAGAFPAVPTTPGIPTTPADPNAPMTDFERNNGLDMMAELADKTTTTTLGFPGQEVNALEQLARRAQASPGSFAGQMAGMAPGYASGILGALLGGKAASQMYSDIAERGFIPQFDSTGQIVATINPQTGQFGKGSVESRIAGYTPPEEGNEPGDTTFLIAGGGGSGVPAEEAAEIIKSLGNAAPAPTTPTTPSTPTPSQPVQLGRSLGFGYGTMPQVSSNLDMAMNNFFNMLGGYAEGGEVKKFANGGYTDTSSLEGLMEASGAETAAGQAISDAMDSGSGDDGPPMNDFGGGDVQTIMATPVETQTVTVQPMQNQQSAADIMQQQSSNLADLGIQAGRAVGDFVSGLVAPSQSTVDAAKSMSSLSPQTPDLLNANMPIGGQLTSVPIAAQYADYKPTAAGIEQGIQGLSQVGTQRESGFSLPSMPSLSDIGKAIMGSKPTYDNMTRFGGSGAAPF